MNNQSEIERLDKWTEECFTDCKIETGFHWGLYDYTLIHMYDDGLYQGLKLIAEYIKSHPSKFTQKYHEILNHEFWAQFE